MTEKFYYIEYIKCMLYIKNQSELNIFLENVIVSVTLYLCMQDCIYERSF